MSPIRRWILHPFLFGLTPALALLSHNLSQVKPAVGARSLAISLSVATILLLALRILLRDRYKAAMVTSLSLILFFLYGHAYNILKQTEVFGMHIGRHRFLLPAWIAVFVVGFWWINRNSRAAQSATEALNVIAIVAFVLPAIQLVSFQAHTHWTDLDVPALPMGNENLQVPEGQTPPDIYYIILDAYARADILQESFNFDNQDFLDHLAEMGFFVATHSQSNYAQTELSLASSLNYNYLDSLGDRFVPDNTDRSPLWPLIQRNAVGQSLKELGYTIVAFETGYYWTQLENADIYFSPSNSLLEEMELTGSVNSFETMLIKTSAGLLVTDLAHLLPKYMTKTIKYPHKRHRERVLYDLTKLREIPLSIESPKFIFAHIVTPHEPFVFGPQGELVTYPETLRGEQYKEAYRNQVIYINQRITALVDEIINSPKSPPVIILQADHGPGPVSPAGRMAIFNAYYLPDGGTQILYEHITPVNTFRVIFNHYLGGDFDLLEDRSYFSTYQAPYDFAPIPIMKDTEGR